MSPGRVVTAVTNSQQPTLFHITLLVQQSSSL